MVRAADIAKELKLSKAAVSLALNNKAGVSDKTRAAVFRCKAELEAREQRQKANIIKMVTYRDEKNISACFLDHSAELLQNGIMEKAERILQKNGYVLNLSYYTAGKDTWDGLLRECNALEVAGVLFTASELPEKEKERLSQIKKPIVVSDCDLSDRYHSLLLNNVSAVNILVKYLTTCRCRNIVYLRKRSSMLNFMERRRTFEEERKKNHLMSSESRIIETGEDADEIRERMLEYLKTNPLPDAFLCENIQVSIGAVNALLQSGYRIPEDVSVVGVDEVPEQFLGGIRLTSTSFSHVERVELAISLLLREIEEEMFCKFLIAANPVLTEGESVRKM